jgi:hypothetical protein
MLINPKAQFLQPFSNATSISLDENGNIQAVVGGTCLAELITHGVVRPSTLEKNLDSRIAEIRRNVQRRFTAERMKNCKDYTDYILAISQGREGVLPPITLCSLDPLMGNERGEVCRAAGSPLFAIDGETQLEAVFAAAEENSNIRDGLSLSFILHVVKAPEIAQLYAHDLNAKGRSIKESEVATLNVLSPVISAIKVGVEISGVAGGLSAINRSGEGMGSKFKPYATTYGRLLYLALGVHHGLENSSVSLDSFLKHHSQQGSLPINAETAISTAVSMYLDLPRAQRIALKQEESRALGMVFHTYPDDLTERTAARILHNRARMSGRGPKRERFRALTAGLI